MSLSIQSLWRSPAGACALLIAALAPGLAAPAAVHAAEPLEFYALIDGTLGRPPNNSSGRGIGHFTLNETQDVLTFDIVFDPWIDDELFAHIHVDSIGNGGAEEILYDLDPGPHKWGTMAIKTETHRQALIGGHFFVVVHSISVRLGELVGWIRPGTPAQPATWGRVKATYR